MIQFEEYKVRLNELKPKLAELRVSLDIDHALEELERLHSMQESEGFWDDTAKSQKIVRQTRNYENTVESYRKMESMWDDLMTICEMALEESDDSMLGELKEGFETLESSMETARLETLLTGEYDNSNALVSFHAGAGGT